MTAIIRLADAVIKELGQHRKLRRVLNVGNSVTLEGIPLMPEGEFAGVPFVEVRRRPHTTSPNVLRTLYEQVVWLGANPDPHQPIVKIVGAVAGVRQAAQLLGPTPQAGLIRLLWWISCHEVAELELGEHTCLVHGLGDPMGIRQGQILSRFASGHSVSADPRWVLANPGNRITVRDRSFINLWRFAIRCRGGDDLLKALALLWAVDAATLHRVARALTHRPLSETRKKELKATVLAARDPMGKLFSRLVPMTLTRSEFERHFGSMVDRKVPPDDKRRQVLYTKLSMLFQKEQ